MKIKVYRKSASTPDTYDNATNAYTQDNMYTVLKEVGAKQYAYKYSVYNLNKVIEEVEEA